MEAIWMPTPEAIELHFDKARPLLERCISRFTKPEFGIEELRDMAMRGDALIGVAMDGEKPVLAAAFNIVRYDKFTALNVLAIGGRRMREVANIYFEDVLDFAKSKFVGATCIEAHCRPAMVKLLRQQLGGRFKPVSQTLRYELAGEQND